MTALRYLLGGVAGCAAPLWCRVWGHGPTSGPIEVNGAWRYCCLRCGECV